jgi:hypothetical protein
MSALVINGRELIFGAAVDVGFATLFSFGGAVA